MTVFRLCIKFQFCILCHIVNLTDNTTDRHCNELITYLPVQSVFGSLPSYPALQAHVYEPTVFVQSAFSAHGELPHSLMSVRRNR